MRIALSNPDVGLGGGVERVVAELANHLARSGHEVTVFAARVEAAVLDESVRRQIVPVPVKLDARVGVGFRRVCAGALRSARPSFEAHGAFSALCPLGGVFWVPSVHRVGFELLLSRRGAAGRALIGANPYHRVRLAMEGSMLAPGATRQVLAQTSEVAADVRRCYPRAPDVGVLPLGYDDERFNPAERERRRPEARRQLGLSAEQPVLAFVANELERKGFDRLLEALERLPSVVLIGAGRVAPDRVALDAAAAGARVQWLGHARDVMDLYAAADAFVLPTRYEPWGLVIVEALAAGLPVVTTKLAGAASVIRGGTTGSLLDDPEDVDALVDGIRWALSTRPSDTPSLSASVAHLAWGKIADRYLEVLADGASS